MGKAGSKPTEAFGGYGFAIRTFWFKTTELRIGRKWFKEAYEDSAAKFDVSIGGKAQSKDKVVIIGEKNGTNVFHFNLNADDPAESWAFIKGADIDFDAKDVSTPERKLKKHIFEQLDEAPPTAALYWHEADREIGIEEGWVIECTISREVRDQLVQDLLAGKANEIEVGIRWVSGLVWDKHAPPSAPNTWGLFRIEADHEPETLHGHVESLTWELRLPQALEDRKI